MQRFLTMKHPGGAITQLHKKDQGRNGAVPFLAACFLLFFCLPASGNPDHVTVESGSPDNATRYSITSGVCSITWIAYNTELNAGVVKHSSQCSEPLSQQLPLLTQICKEFFRKDTNTPAFRTLFWGGLIPENSPASLEMSLRLALAAYRSPGWDAKKGKPKKGNINRFVKDLANSELIYPELKELFERFHRSILLASVEKVRVLEAKKLPFYDQLKRQGIQPADKLPFDCMAWFSVSEVKQDQSK